MTKGILAAMRFIQACFLCVALSACTATEIGIATMASIIWTEKLPTDYALGWVSGRTCNTVQALEDKGPVCRGPDYRLYPVIETPPQWCYESLGDVTCYTRPDPDPLTSTFR